MTSLHDFTDGELITLYKAEKSESAMRTLVGRHHVTLHERFRRELPDEADARDLQHTGCSSGNNENPLSGRAIEVERRTF